MTVVYVLAHFDDEYCALPLIRRAVAQGREHLFIHVVDYRNPRMGARRRRETVAFLAAQGIPATSQIHLGARTGWWDGELDRHAGPAYEALKAAVPGPVERVVVPAWEGGHPDHWRRSAAASRSTRSASIRARTCPGSSTAPAARWPRTGRFRRYA
jgi:LmbE family N-acetylglucosaminyl deacetylase